MTREIFCSRQEKGRALGATQGDVAAPGRRYFMMHFCRDQNALEQGRKKVKPTNASQEQSRERSSIQQSQAEPL